MLPISCSSDTEYSKNIYNTPSTGISVYRHLTAEDVVMLRTGISSIS